MDNQLLKEITSINGISSFEKNVKKFIQDKLKNYFMDGIGSIVSKDTIDERMPNLLFVSHMDEVGYIVEDIEGKYLKLKNIGSLWTHLVVGQLYKLVNKNGDEFIGVISSPSSHALPKSEKSKIISDDKIYLDLGLEEDEIKKYNINVGDMCVPYTVYENSPNGKYVISKALDDRVGCYVGLEILRKKINKKNNLYWGFAVQEEPGLRGARSVTNMTNPDMAFALDTTLAGDTPFDDNTVSLGKGVVLSCIDSNTLAHRGLLVWLEELCEKHGIAYQLAVFNKGGTDSGNIHKSLAGVVNMSISIPIRYMHTNNGMIHSDDVDACIELISKIIEEFDYEILKEIKG